MKKPRKPRQFMKYPDINLLNPDDCVYGTDYCLKFGKDFFTLKFAKKYYKWLGQAIAYLESKEKRK